MSSYEFVGDWIEMEWEGEEEEDMVLPICYGCDTLKVAEGYIRISQKKTLFLCKACAATTRYANKVFHPL